ncbi:MAG: polysaccharide deacetylase family protein [Lachnospiraceae bacterium]|nr:polysaccharide deacetylase family protein [Lachnospiraceae bacterium]
MSRFKATVLVFDILLGLLLLFMAIFRKDYYEAGGITGNTAEYDKDYETKKIAITFDDGPHPYYTEQLLDGLKERGVRATFFVTGEHAELHPDIIRRMQEEGHLIGNHTYSHIQLTDSNSESFKEELIKTNEIIKEITGEEVQYVRPPYGSWDKSFEQELNMFPVLWTVDPLDWCSSNVSCITDKIVENVEENDIILMHDYYDTSVTAALNAIDELLEEGYSFVTVEEILFD